MTNEVQTRVLSKHFLPQNQKMSKSIYRECSEFAKVQKGKTAKTLKMLQNDLLKNNLG